MKLKGVWGASLLMVAVAASSCEEEQRAPQPELSPASVRTTRQEANSESKVLILGTTVNDGANSREAQAASMIGKTVVVVTPEEWGAMTAEDFMTYEALIIGDAACQSGETAFQAAIDNRNVWGAIVDGNVAIIGADPATNNTTQLVENALMFVTERPYVTGMYVALGCAYQDAPAGTAVTLLEPFGAFQVTGVGCADGGHMFGMSLPTFSDFVWDFYLPGDSGCAARSVFTQYPDRTFAFATLATHSGGPLPGEQLYEDYFEGVPYVGTPYILVRGAMAQSAGCGYWPEPSGEECDLGDFGNGVPASDGQSASETCSYSCKLNWCGDGVVDTLYGEECDMGVNNGRDFNGTINMQCSGFCKVPNIPPPASSPPDAICQNVTVAAQNTCGVDADINNGSTDPDGDLVNCTQTPAGPYPIGNTTVTLTCFDSTDKTDSCTGVVTVQDQVVPTIALVGAATESLECGGGSYTDPGATASDLCSGDMTSAIVTTGSVNPSVAATYTLTYDVTDEAGNSPPEVTRTVTVTDTQTPTLTLNGLANEALECGTPYADPGASASDVCAGDLTGSVVRTGAVDHLTPNSYPLTYDVSDPSGNAATQVSRVVTVSDTQAPAVTLNGETNLAVECGDSTYTDPGASANDACAGTLAAVPSTVADPNQEGTYTISYSATDPSGNVGTSSTSRTVTVSDNLPPSLTLNGPAAETLECASPYMDPGASASDQCAGDLTASIVKTGAVDPNMVGSYGVTYDVTDPAGLSAPQVSRTVDVVDTQVPAVTLNGETNLAVECGDSTYTDPGASASDACAGTLTAVPSTVADPSQEGTYTISYSATDPSGNVGTSSTSRTVTVSDNLPPSLTLNGSATQTLECASPYTDQGATASDQCAGDLTGSIVASSTVDPNAVGSYGVTYNVTDPAGLSATPVSRTVDVVDTQAPAVTLVGATDVAVECGDDTYTDPGAEASDACAGTLAAVPSTVANPDQEGTYTISYSATDPSGNTGTSSTSRTVTVSDNLAPSLTLNGPAAETVECASPYMDPGASASDQCAGDLTAAVVKSGAVDPNTVGSYAVTYNVTDPAGLSAPPVSRTVDVTDTQVPTVTLNGETNLAVECGDDTYADPGASASDACAGTLTAVASTVANPDQPGSYTISYSATDPSGNVGTSSTSRTVTVSDNLPPTLALNGSATQSLECGSTYTDQGATASDQCAGDLTGSVVTSGTVDPSTLGDYQVTYNVTDPTGLSATPVSRTVSVSDTQKPVVSVNEPLSQQFECGSGAYVDPGATASDACAGALTAVATTTVDPNAPGNYDVGYSATDPSGNVGTSSVTRSVTVADTQAPTLALLGSSPQSLECGTDYVDPGATANDQCAGDLTSLVTKTGSVDKQTPGPYTLTYNVTDPAGLSATPVDRTVNVSDTLVPSITVLGPLSDTYECGSGPYPDPGASASDVCAGDLTAAVQATQTGDPSKPGQFTISYSVADPSGNMATASEVRTVTVNDTDAPVLTLNGSATQSLECGTDFVDPGAKADDACFGDLTSSITVDGSVNKQVPAPYTLTYNVTDPAGLSATPVSRTVTVSDTLAPSISVNEPLSMSFECGSGTFVDPGAVASDVCAGDLTGSVQVIGSVNPDAAGNYTLSYKVADPSGNEITASATRTVSVTDTSAPVLTLNGLSTESLECGTTWSDPGATADDACAGDLTASIQVAGTVDASAPNSYLLTYSVADPSGLTDSETRTVNVSDTQAPSLTLVGSATQAVECGSNYADPGALATDVCAGDLPVTVTGAVDATVLGSYTVSYNAEDPSGNSAPEVTRAVTVSDTLAPSITVNGALEQQHECGSTYTDPGASATDQCAGAVAVQATQTGDPNQPGQFTISYSAADPSGNSVTSSTVRTVTVSDTSAPTLALNGADTQTVECGTGYTDPGATANDACFGDLTADIQQSGSVNPSVPNVYTLIYNVTDPAGQSAPSVSRTVTVADTQVPTLTLVGSANELYECGTTYTDPGATAADSCFGDLTGAIVATRTTDPNNPDNFTITYNVADPEGNSATPITRSVTVNDQEAPTIVLNGPASQVLECSRQPYDDPGASAEDVCVGPVPVQVSGSVNMGQAGTYQLSYVAQDPSGNTSPTLTRDVTVTDTTGPAITLNGDTAIYLECAVDTYTELGATADDICAGPVPVAIDESAVNEAVVGAYLVNYTASDLSGNTSSTVRNVLVEDHLPPAITLTNNTPEANTVECGMGPFNDPGATALDVCQGDVSSSVFVEFSSVDHATEGAYIVRYQASDAYGNVAQATRDVTVDDTTAPVITVVTPYEEVECGTQPSLGVTATDACYGDLTSSVVANPATLPNDPGEHVVTYSVTDPAGHTVTDGASRTISIVDTTLPVLTVNGPTEIYYECTGHAVGNVWENPGATATDSCEGELLVHQYNTGDDDGDGFAGCDPETPVEPCDPDDFGPGPTTEVEGLYYVQYLAWDESFNIQGAILSVYVQDTIKPMLFLNGSDYLQTQCFLPTDDPTDGDTEVDTDSDPFLDPGAIADDMCYGDITPQVLTFGEVNKQYPGTYPLEYQVYDGAFNWADPITRTVEVIDNLAPKTVKYQDVVATPADNTMRTVELSECALIWDRCEGYMDINTLALITAITPNEPVPDGDIVIVDNSTFQVRAVAGREYDVTFTVTDSSGNTATSAPGTCKVVVPASATASSSTEGTGITGSR